MVTARRFDHQRGGDWPGKRGLVVEVRRHTDTSRVFAVDFPSAWVTDSIEVELDRAGGAGRPTSSLAWIDAVRPHLIEATHRAATSPPPPATPRADP
ncbi:hypothetical protein GCM10009789_40320 [Kribbella sancticallisti]|uniref:Uncharacterized protein n=1 Tax=Kribbella sancticallisti TaxID=460087 RepID=A0ABP4PMJ0_9ACTN